MNKPGFTLPSGRAVRHEEMPNGAQDVFMVDGASMTESEWEEYCQICLNRSNDCFRKWTKAGVK